MEEKEPIKVNVSTVLLILAVIVILIMSICIGILYKENMAKGKELEISSNVTVEENTTNTNNTENVVADTTTNELGRNTSNSEKNATTSTNNTNKSGTKLIQFDTEFYKLEDVALEYRELGNIKNYKDFEYDLDGDGVKDKITITHKTEKVEIGDGRTQEDDIYYIQLNGNSFLDSKNDDVYGIDKLYIVDLNKNDNKLEVVFDGNGPSDDPHYVIFSKNGSKMKKQVGIDGIDFMTDRQGTVVVDNMDGGITPKVYNKYYVIKNSNLEEKELSGEKIKNITFKSEQLFFVKDLDNPEDLFESGEEPKGGKYEFNIIKFTNRDGALYVKLKDGQKGLMVRARGYLAG